jgi:hypothetical protein
VAGLEPNSSLRPWEKRLAMRHGACIAIIPDGIGAGGIRCEQSGFFPGSFREAWDCGLFYLPQF